ncbi:lysozyme g-like [Centropristis striata]|uniref:lysozyme g-like n=1 Tax=Centropristis striata TaxID=184440 RepID=UPI0027DFD6E8|nr:lysozyme g-like [Centropristis striata]
MPPKNVKAALIRMLKNLTPGQLEHFRHTILDRKEEPQVTRDSLEGKDCLVVADVLVNYFTEPGAIEVALETLGEIDCNEQKKRLAEALKDQSLPVTTAPAPVCRFGDIMKVETTGASAQTAQQDKLPYSGLQASFAMAETDLMDMNNYKSIIQNVAREKGLDPALIAAIISRSCRAGKTLKGGRGCYNPQRGEYDTYGLMQLDVNPKGGGHIPKGAWDSEEHLSQAIDILLHFMLRIKHRFYNWTKEQQLKGGIAAYNAGDMNIDSYENVDAKTSCGDYSNDVVARAQWYKSDGGF